LHGRRPLWPNSGFYFRIRGAERWIPEPFVIRILRIELSLRSPTKDRP
jgi:hypothetical protein